MDITLQRNVSVEASIRPIHSGKSLYRIRVEELLNQVLTKKLLSGVIVGLLHDDLSETFTVGSGVAEDSIIELGSVSKVFTGLLLCAMVERGIVAFNDPIHRYLPPEFAAKIGKCPIRILDLATHRAGFPAQPLTAGRMKRHIHDPYFGYSAADLLKELSQYDLQRATEQQYSYSNLGYAVLGYILEKASGMPFSELMRTLVLEPLSLKNSCIEVTSEQESRIPQGYTQVGRKAMRWRSQVLSPAGGICSTCGDCLRFLNFFIHDSGSLKSAIDRMLKPNPGSSTEETKVLTWKQRPNEEWLWHNGVTGSFSAYIGFHQEHKRGVVLLTNRYAIELITELGQHVQAILMDKPASPLSGQYGTAKAYAAQGLIEFVESSVWLRAVLAGLATGICSWLLLR